MRTKQYKFDYRVKNLITTYEPIGVELEEYLDRLRNEKGFARVYVHRTMSKIISGFEKYTLCKKHNIPYEVVYLNFKSRDELYQWAVNNYLQKENLSNWKRSSLAVKHFKKYYEELAKANQKLSQGRGKKGKKNTNSPFRRVNVNAELAREAGVSRDTMVKAKYIMNNGNDELLCI